MDWQDEGFIIGARRHGETSLILEVMTRRHGRHLGLVKGGRSRRAQPLLQPGNAVSVTWRARLEEHLGFFAVDTTRLAAAAMMAAPASLHGLNLVAGLLRLLAEREPHEALYDHAARVLAVLEAVAAPGAPQASTVQAGAALVRFELAVLADTGFGLDLDGCAVTGARDDLARGGLARPDLASPDLARPDLAYVSPRSGRAVGRDAGRPWADRLLALPAFLLEDVSPTLTDVEAGFALTGHFLRRDLFEPRGLPLPPSRDAYRARLRRDGE